MENVVFIILLGKPCVLLLSDKGRIGMLLVNCFIKFPEDFIKLN